MRQTIIRDDSDPLARERIHSNAALIIRRARFLGSADSNSVCGSGSNALKAGGDVHCSIPFQCRVNANVFSFLIYVPTKLYKYSHLYYKINIADSFSCQRITITT